MKSTLNSILAEKVDLFKKRHHKKSKDSADQSELDQNRSYFKGLNYSLANEDTTFELTLAEHYKPQNILSICGSGGRSLPFLAVGPSKLTLVDLSQVQLDFARLKYFTMSQLSLEQYLIFWGFPPFRPEDNKAYRVRLLNDLQIPKALKDFARSLLSAHKNEGLILKGHWEKSYTLVANALRPILSKSFKKSYDRLFEFNDLSLQQEFVAKALKNPFWVALPRMVVFAFGNRVYFNALLYKGAMVRKNIDTSYYDFYLKAFRHLLTKTLAKENFFLQLSFFGRLVDPKANPPEATEKIFKNCKANFISTDVAFLKSSIIPSSSPEDQDCESLLHRGPYDFVSLSDVPSYLQGDMEKNFLRNLATVLKPSAIVISRCYLHVPENTNLEGFEDITHEWDKQINEEKTQMYKIFVYKYLGSTKG